MIAQAAYLMGLSFFAFDREQNRILRFQRLASARLLHGNWHSLNPRLTDVTNATDVLPVPFGKRASSFVLSLSAKFMLRFLPNFFARTHQSDFPPCPPWPISREDIHQLTA
jgi:hypothetical protein